MSNIPLSHILYPPPPPPPPRRRPRWPVVLCGIALVGLVGFGLSQALSSDDSSEGSETLAEAVDIAQAEYPVLDRHSDAELEDLVVTVCDWSRVDGLDSDEVIDRLTSIFVEGDIDSDSLAYKAFVYLMVRGQMAECPEHAI